MSHPGGKAGAGVYQRIINEIPPHDVYVEAFLGDGAVMRRKRPAARNIGIELNPGTAARFAGQNLGFPVEVHNCCAIEWLKHAFGLYLLEPPPNAAASADAARSYVVRSHGPAERWFVYIDPPYLLGTRRTKRIYQHELTDARHVELLDVAKRLPCPVAISGYWSPLYEAALEGWRWISFGAMTRGGHKAQEFVWFNYPPPLELHDYRYLGNEKRQRERVSRKVRTWAAGLQRLPRLERQAILAALDPAARSRDAGQRR